MVFLRKETIHKILSIQKSEISEHVIYARLAKMIREPENAKILKKLSEEEKTHYEKWKEYTKQDVSPDSLKVLFYTLVSKFLGLAFGLKLMERGEETAQETYNCLSKEVPLAKQIQAEENAHEQELLRLIDEEHLNYVGSIVLGLNDALVELTGALAGLTFALQNAPLVAIAGLVTGIAASFSMAASEYLSIKAEHDNSRSPLRASVYTGIAYIITVVLLILPYLLLADLYVSLAITLVNALFVIFAFTFYVSVAQEIPFRKRFLEMAFLSMGVAFLSFIVGIAMRVVFNLDV